MCFSFYLRHVAGLQELHVAVVAVAVVVVVVVVVVVGVLVGGAFLKCAPIGLTASRPNSHWSHDSTHHGTQIK